MAPMTQFLHLTVKVADKGTQSQRTTSHSSAAATIRNSINGWLALLPKMSLYYKLCKRANASSWAHSQLRSRLLSSNDFNRRRGVVMSITASIWSPPSRLMHRTLIQMRRWTVAIHRRWYRTLWASITHLCQVTLHFFYVLRHLNLFFYTIRCDSCCRKPQGSLRSFSLTRAIFLSIPNHFTRIQSSRSQYFTSYNQLLSQLFFTEGLLQKPPSSSDLPLIGPRRS